MTLILNGTDNSATVPAVQGGTAGTTTGVYYPSTNQVAISTAGTQAVLVDASQNTTLTGNLNAPNTFGFKNRIINGGMVIDQRNAGASVTQDTSGTQYCLDRWNIYGTVASKFTVQQTPSATETGYATRVAAGFTNYLAITSASAYSVSASDVFQLQQMIEGFNTSDLAWGTASAKTVTLSFLVYSSLTGTFGGSLVNSAANYSYPFTYSIPVANTWTSISVTVAGPTAGTWIGATNGIGIRVYFGLGVGSTNSGTAGSWSANLYRSATGAVSVVGTSGATFYITGVQLEKGSTATSFDYRPYATEFIYCQRYYEVGESTFYGPAGTNYFPIPFAVYKAISPTVTRTGVGSITGATAGTTVSTVAQYRFYFTNNTVVGGSWAALAEL